MPTNTISSAFRQWLSEQSGREDHIGRLAGLVSDSECCSASERLVAHLASVHWDAFDGVYFPLIDAVCEWEAAG